MYRVYDPVTEEESARAEEILQTLRERGLKIKHLEKLLLSTSIKFIASGKMRPNREVFERIISLGALYEA